MPEIGTVTIEPVPLPEVRGIPSAAIMPVAPPVTQGLDQPVTLQIGVPIVEMPGCVAVHPDAKLNPSLLEDDPGRVGMFCPNGQIPHFEPLDFTPGEYVPIKQQTPRGSEDSEDQESTAPKPPAIPRLPESNAPTTQTTEQPPKEKPFIEQAIDGLPDVGAVVTTTTIALVATTSALVAKPLADLILKTIKPTVKKTVKAIAKIRGKTVEPESVWERRVSQRERNLAIRTLRRALKP